MSLWGRHYLVDDCLPALPTNLRKMVVCLSRHRWFYSLTVSATIKTNIGFNSCISHRVARIIFNASLSLIVKRYTTRHLRSHSPLHFSCTTFLNILITKIRKTRAKPRQRLLAFAEGELRNYYSYNFHQRIGWSCEQNLSRFQSLDDSGPSCPSDFWKGSCPSDETPYPLGEEQI